MSGTSGANGYRRGTWRIIVLEFWERFSYYGILAILVLFMTSPTARGGFGWSNSHALNLLAVFTAFAFILPTLGGYVADRWLGTRRAVLTGASLLVLGNTAVAVAALGPLLARHGIELAAATHILYAGLAAVALGNGLFKSSLVTLLGTLVPGDDAQRDQVFRYYYQAVMIGALAAALCVGALAEAAGWWAGFALAAVGMAISWLMFVTWRPSPEISTLLEHKPPARATPEETPSRSDRGQVVSIGILCVFLVLITIGWVQLHGLWLLEFERSGDRTVGAFTIPSAWLLAMNGIVVGLFSPVVGKLWLRIVAKGVVPGGFVPQFLTAFVIMGLCHLAMAYGFHEAAPGSVPLAWPFACAFFITVAELIFWPSSYNSIHQLAPAHARSTLMGIWLAMLGVGQFFSHQIGRAVDIIGFSPLSTLIGLGMLGGALALWVVARLRPGMRAL